MDEKRTEQMRLIELDREYLALKERNSMLGYQLKEYSTQQGIMGLKVCNIQQEMQLLEPKIAEVQAEREDVYRRIAKMRKGKRRR